MLGRCSGFLNRPILGHFLPTMLAESFAVSHDIHSPIPRGFGEWPPLSIELPTATPCFCIVAHLSLVVSYVVFIFL